MNGKKWALAAVIATLVPLLVALITSSVRLGALTQQLETLIGQVEHLRLIPERVASLEAAQRSLERALELLYLPGWREGGPSG